MGHEVAKLDPLDLPRDYEQHGKLAGRVDVKMLDHQFWGFSDEDLNKEFFIDAGETRGFIGMKTHWKLGELMDALK